MLRREIAVFMTAGFLAFLGGNIAATRATAAPVVISPNDIVTNPDRAFMRQQAMNSYGQMRVAGIALSRSRTSSVRWYAERVFNDNWLALQRLKQIARLQDVTLPERADTAHRRLAARLSRLSGDQFDREFMLAERSHTAMMTARLVRFSGLTRDQELHDFTVRLLPAVQDHSQLARDITVKHGGFVLAHRRRQ